MIRITCTHCRQVLTIDDGFAGGVCRCKHCGTIQTVPAAPGKTQGRGAAPAAKTLYRAAPQTHADDHLHESGSGLEELAEIVSSSGLGSHSRRLRQQIDAVNAPSPGAPAAPNARSGRKLLFLLAPIALILILVLFILIHVLRGSSAPPPPPTALIAVPAPSPPPTPAGPNFAGLPIVAEDTVVYLLDNGGSAGDALSAMEAVCLQSIQTLGPQRRFQVIFWRDGSPIYPPTGTAKATPDEQSKCQAALSDAYAQGATEVDAAMKLAMTSQPDAIVLVTAKGAQLPDDFVQTVLTLRGDSKAKIYTIGLNGDSSADPSKPGLLATLAAQTGGQFLNISSADLNRLAH